MAKNKTSLADLSRIRRETKEATTNINLENENSPEATEKSVSELDNVNSEAKAELESSQSKKVGRPKGIRSNPDYESTTVKLNRKMKAKARYILSTRPQKMDLQTLLNSLLEDFVNQHDPF